MTSILKAEDLTVGYRLKKGRKVILEDINLELRQGEMVCFLGPNGVGKSTLLRTLAGVQPALSGLLSLEDSPLEELTEEELARKLSVVLTEKAGPGQMTVFELVALGRYPHTNWLGQLSQEDKLKVQEAIQNTHIESLTDYKLHQLSDGQLQKVMIARALAQDGDIIILDEPTAHLDLTNRVEIMQLLKKVAHTTRKAIVVSTHELDLALQTADKLWLAAFERPFLQGIPEELVLSGDLSATFKQEGFTFDLTTGRFRLDHEYTRQLQCKGKGPALFWTRHALERNGFFIVDHECPLCVEVIEENAEMHWRISREERVKEVNSLEAMLREIQKEME